MAREYADWKLKCMDIELDLAKISAEELGRLDDPNEMSDAEKRRHAEREKKRPAWEAVGLEKKSEMRRQLYYALAPDAQKQVYDELFGPPDGRPTLEVTPLAGMRQNTARRILALIRSRALSRGAWAQNALHQQLKKDDGLARQRLEKLAEDGPDVLPIPFIPL